MHLRPASLPPRFSAALGSDVQRKRYEEVIQKGINDAITVLDKARTGGMNNWNYESQQQMTPQVLAAMHILNRAFPKVGSDFQPL